MVNQTDRRPGFGTQAPSRTQDGAIFDAGLRSHMLSVYNYMASGVLLTGLVSLLSFNGGWTQSIMMSGGILPWIVMLSPLAFVMVMSFGMNRISTAGLQALFWAFAAVMGLSLSTIFMQYTGTSIAKVFFVTAGSFAGLSLYGYTTKKDLSGMGTFLIMGLIGLIIASVVNIFLGSPVMDFVISVIGVLIFAGLTAYDTQKIKNIYFQVAGSDFAGKAVIMGALNLYLDFINMFLFLLRLFGNRE